MIEDKKIFLESMLKLKKMCELAERCKECPLYSDHMFCLFTKFPRFWNVKRVAEVVEKLYNE